MEKKFESGAAITTNAGVSGIIKTEVYDTVNGIPSTSVYCYEVEIKNPNGGKETVFIYPEDIAD